MSKRVSCLVLALASVLAHAGDEGRLMSELETQTTIAQKRLGLLQAQAAITAFNGTGGQPLPQIVSLYGPAGKTRALIDLGSAGIRDVGPGDAITDTLVVGAIDANKGVEVRLAGGTKGKSMPILYLAMKAAPQPGTQGISMSATQSSGAAAGYPLVPAGVVVPPLQPLPAKR